MTRSPHNATPTVGPYRACPIKRRRSKADIGAIKASIVEVVEADPPMTVRQVFYQLVTRGVIEKTEKEYQQTVIRLMGQMRIAGELDWSSVVDESRQRRVTKTHDSISAAVEDCARFYRRSALKQAEEYVEIWCEKDALAGALWEVTSDYDVPLMISRGMPSLTFSTAPHWRSSALRHGARTPTSISSAIGTRLEC